MNVLMTTSEFPEIVGGVADYSLLLGRELAARGLRVSVLTANDRRVAPQSDMAVLPGVRGWGPASIPALLAQARAASPDWIVLHYGPYMYSGHGLPTLVPLWTLLMRLATGGRVLLLCHELFVVSPTLKYRLIGLVQRAALRALAWSSDLVVVTTDERRRVLEAAGIPAARLHVVRVGSTVPTPTADCEDAGRARPGFRVGVFGALDLERRRLDVVYEAVRRLARGGPGWELVLIGTIGATAKAFLAAHPATDGLTLRCTGVVPPERVSAELGACHASIFLDTHGRQGISSRSTACAAAFGLGVPLVGNRGSDTDSIYREGENVLFCEITPESVENALRALATDTELRRRLSAGGRRLFEAELSWPRIGTAFFTLIAGEADRRRGAAG